MTLDVLAYRNVKPVDNSVSEGDFNGFYITNHSDFPNHAHPLILNERYEGVCKHSFWAFYSDYNRWRDKLAELAGYKPQGDDDHKFSRGAWNLTEGKFWELINFTDCDGVIGSIAAKKLLNDFESFDPSLFVNNDFKTLFNDFHKACQVASNDGAIRFR